MEKIHKVLFSILTKNSGVNVTLTFKNLIPPYSVICNIKSYAFIRHEHCIVLFILSLNLISVAVADYDWSSSSGC